MSAGAPQQWRVIGRSVAGSAHVVRDIPCQDALAWRQLPDGRLILAVADGAGSAARSELGAAAAVEALVDALDAALAGLVADGSDPEGGVQSIQDSETGRAQLAGNVQTASDSDWRDAVIPFDAQAPDPDSDPEFELDPEFQPEIQPEASPSSGSLPEHAHAPAPDPLREAIGRSVAAARAGLEALAAAQGRPLRDYACTLTAVLALPDRLWVAQIGDSVAVARGADGAWQTVGRPQKGEYANEAWFLTADGAMDQLEIRSFDLAAQQIILSSDGLLRLMLQLPGFAPHAPFLEPLARALSGAADPERAGQQLASFLASDRLRARTDDDISLLWAARLVGDSSLGR
jgi:hypothetical protein